MVGCNKSSKTIPGLWIVCTDHILKNYHTLFCSVHAMTKCSCINIICWILFTTSTMCRHFELSHSSSLLLHNNEYIMIIHHVYTLLLLQHVIQSFSCCKWSIKCNFSISTSPRKLTSIMLNGAHSKLNFDHTCF